MASRLSSRLPFGVPLREKLFDTEDSFFRKNPHVAGMAAEDDHVILNPYSSLSGEERDSVAVNEAARVHMRKNKIAPTFGVTDQQRKSFSGTAYENDEHSMKETIAARIYAKDPSAGEPTAEQLDFVDTHLNRKRKTLLGGEQ